MLVSFNVGEVFGMKRECPFDHLENPSKLFRTEADSSFEQGESNESVPPEMHQVLREFSQHRFQCPPCYEMVYSAFVRLIKHDLSSGNLSCAKRVLLSFSTEELENQILPQFFSNNLCGFGGEDELKEFLFHLGVPVEMIHKVQHTTNLIVTEQNQQTQASAGQPPSYPYARIFVF